MTINITWGNLDEAIKQLRELAKKIEQFPKDVAQESMSHINYSGTGVSYSEGENKVFASGDQIAFAEFGAGYYADVTTLNVNGQSMESYPGVWSEDHAQTFQYYSGDPNSYKYNRVPQHQMQNEVERLRSDTEQKAKDYFS